MLTSKTIMQKIENNMDKIKMFGVKKIGLFGSYIKNEQKPDSDLDFLIEFEEGKKTFDNYMDLKFLLENMFNRQVDLVVFEALKPDLKPYILETVKYASGV